MGGTSHILADGVPRQSQAHGDLVPGRPAMYLVWTWARPSGPSLETELPTWTQVVGGCAAGFLDDFLLPVWSNGADGPGPGQEGRAYARRQPKLGGCVMAAESDSLQDEHSGRLCRLPERLWPDTLGPVPLGAQHRDRVQHRRGDWPVEHGGDLAVADDRRAEVEHERVTQAGVLPELAAGRLLQALGGLDMGLPGGAQTDGELPRPKRSSRTPGRDGQLGSAPTRGRPTGGTAAAGRSRLAAGPVSSLGTARG